MILPPKLENESARLEALANYQILDTPIEEEFEGITRLIANVCDVPIALVSLVDEGRQWFKSELGFGIRETPLDRSFCAHAVASDETMLIPDALKDQRFATNPLVEGGPGIRFYAGALLKTEDGFALGTLCVLDTEPRELDPDQIDALEIMAVQVMKLLQLRRELRLRSELAKRLDSALKAREQVLAVVSHDLRNPLTTVMMGAAHFKSVARDSIETRGAQRLLRAAKSMMRLVEDLLDFESLDRGQLSLALDEVPSEALIDELQESFEMTADAAEVLLQTRCEFTGAVRCDRERLLQALGNLVSNAIKATPPGGAVKLDCFDEGDEVVISVRDDGPGFDDESSRQLFQPFWRGRNKRARGAGLGLAISQGIVEAHHGRINAKSEPGSGATFFVRLPLAA